MQNQFLVGFIILILGMIFLNNRFQNIEGYTNCIKKSSINLVSFHFNQQYSELSILRDVDLGNRAYKVGIPLKKIQEMIHKNKEKLIYMIILKEKRLFDFKEKIKAKHKSKDVKEVVPEDANKIKTESLKIPFIDGYSKPLPTYSTL